MMSGNYPPGVTGNEFAIAGPAFEEESNVKCSECGGITMAYGYRHERWLVCQDCKHIMDDLDTSEPDPDRAYDEARERMLFGDDTD